MGLVLSIKITRAINKVLSVSEPLEFRFAPRYKYGREAIKCHMRYLKAHAPFKYSTVNAKAALRWHFGTWREGVHDDEFFDAGCILDQYISVEEENGIIDWEKNYNQENISVKRLYEILQGSVEAWRKDEARLWKFEQWRHKKQDA